MKAEVGNNTLGVIELEGDFRGIPLDGSIQPMGIVHCCATQHGGGVTIAPVENACDGSVRAFWLPWKNGQIVSAQRADYEDACDYFLTAKLEGCRFSLTETEVHHIAANVPGGRTYAELKKIGFGVASRRLSVSSYEFLDPDNPSQSYGNPNGGGGGTAILFGYKTPGGWVYKGLLRPTIGAETNTWFEIDTEF